MQIDYRDGRRAVYDPATPEQVMDAVRGFLDPRDMLDAEIEMIRLYRPYAPSKGEPGYPAKVPAANPIATEE